METVPEISFRNLESTPALRAQIDEEIGRLERFFDGITSCHVMVEVPNPRRREGNLYHVRIEVRVPGTEVVVSREPPAQQKREELRVAVTEAFDAMVRQLEDYVRKLRGQVKSREELPRGRVARLFTYEGYGFIETPEGEEYYFHRNSVLSGAFDDLEIGTPVRFAVEEGVEGPQASTVHVLGGPAVPAGEARSEGEDA
ncbi:MAG: HPF/RaiA family ribosome-associated protein [Candidatus Palauibacterales bacterium]|nr:HPF/RaiA family ribosome-associated protein [Candidatus Palauibacterales bacterium]MDP2528709.1 HPF/RaiA family ribosome-associated protein [Candidatus Palauibacterales bacterium]